MKLITKMQLKQFNYNAMKLLVHFLVLIAILSIGLAPLWIECFDSDFISDIKDYIDYISGIILGFALAFYSSKCYEMKKVNADKLIRMKKEYYVPILREMNECLRIYEQKANSAVCFSHTVYNKKMENILVISDKPQISKELLKAFEKIENTLKEYEESHRAMISELQKIASEQCGELFDTLPSDHHIFSTMYADIRAGTFSKVRVEMDFKGQLNDKIRNIDMEKIYPAIKIGIETSVPFQSHASIENKVRKLFGDAINTLDIIIDKITRRCETLKRIY